MSQPSMAKKRRLQDADQADVTTTASSQHARQHAQGNGTARKTPSAQRHAKARQVRLSFGRQGRRQRDDEAAARRQGREPRRDEPHRAARPAGFTITTEVCTYYYANKRTYPPALKSQIEAGIAALEKETGKKFGDPKNPLLVSFRSGARDSMPGMMDTILNLGLNDQTVEALSTQDRQRALRVGQLSPLRADVRRRRAGRAEAPDEEHEPFET